MKRIALSGIAFFICLVSKADYSSLPLTALISKADLIAECKIISVQEITIEVMIVEVIKGNTKETKITVSKFRNWTCASRWSAYKVGQTELLFLAEVATNAWYILGAGDEGEMPVQNDSVYYKLIDYQIDSTAKTYNLNEGIISGYKYLLTDVKAGIKQYWTDKFLIDKLIKQKAIRKYKTQNRFLERIIDELKEMAYY